MSSKIIEGKLTAWERWELANFDAPTGPSQQDADAEVEPLEEEVPDPQHRDEREPEGLEV